MTELEAELLTVSADATEDQGTGASFCTARLLIGDAELSKPNGKVFLPGMPAEAFLTTQDRTILCYLTKSLMDQIAHAMRER
ncbi:MAG: hypothetical protein IE937_11070 [Gammaproteobacteria bacterium]|nr:hypothetical protein [Gammaproteobacteria bacterium]